MKPSIRVRLKLAMLVASCGTVFVSLSCVSRLTNLVGSGLTAGGFGGAFGLGSPAAIGAGAGLDLVSDVLHWLR